MEELLTRYSALSMIFAKHLRNSQLIDKVMDNYAKEAWTRTDGWK